MKDWKDLLDAAPMCCMVCAPDGVISFVNLAVSELTGFTREEVMGRDIAMLLPGFLTGPAGGRGKARWQGAGLGCEILTKSGQRIPVSLSCASLRNSEGGLNGLVCCATDQRHTHRIEQALRQSELLLGSVFDAIPDLMVVRDRDLRVVLANQPGGGAEEAGSGWTPHACGTNGGGPCSPCLARQVFEDGAPRRREGADPRDGHPCEHHVYPVFDADGAVVMVIEHFHDISERKRLEDQLHQAQKLEAIGTLAGGIAHDFNNIIGVILGYAQMAALRGAEPRILEYFNEISLAADRAGELVRQILSFSRHAPEVKKPVQLRPVVKEALKLLRSTLPTSIEIRQEIAADLPPVLADPIRIHQVLMNLCTNAKHAMREEKGVLGVRLRRRRLADPSRDGCPGLTPGDYLELEVSDTGCGMDERTVRRIFDPFYTTKAPGQGTGLGLSVVHGIVTGLGGAVTVSSRPDEGSVFHVLLPVYAGDEQGERGGEQGAGDVPRGRGAETILLVDDDTALALTMEKMLQELGYRPTVCTDSGRAWDFFERHPEAFDLVITDMTMPGLNGMDLSRKILAMSPATPIILCTGFSELIDEQTARAAGIRAYLTKPVSLTTLANALREALTG